MKLFTFFVFLMALISGVLFVKQDKAEYQTLRGYIFGTYYVVKVRTSEPIKDFAAMVDAEFDKVNAHLSVFEKKSELNQLNLAKAYQKQKVSAELYLLLEASQKVYQQSNGMFDPTVGPLIELWGFGVNKEHKVPDNVQIQKTLASVDLNKIKLLPNREVVKTQSNLTLNLSAIAKGYAVDMVAKALLEKGYKDFLVDIGGEIYAAGARNEKEQGWNVGIAVPAEKEYENSFAVVVYNMAVATSGNYRNFYYINGKKYAHTLNPKTGYPVNSNLLSVSVFADSCMMADAYATAIMAMGEKEGLAFAEKNQIPTILFVGDDPNTVEIIYSSEAKSIVER